MVTPNRGTVSSPEQFQKLAPIGEEQPGLEYRKDAKRSPIQKRVALEEDDIPYACTRLEWKVVEK